MRDTEKMQAITKVVQILRQRGHSSVKEAVDFFGDSGITSTVVAEAVRRGMLRMLPAEPHRAARWLQEVVGEGLLKQAGLWTTGKKWPGIAFRPVVFVLGESGAEFQLLRHPKQGEASIIRYGQAVFPYWWKGRQAKRVLVVGSALEALKAVSQGHQGHVMGIPGWNTWRPEWFDMICRKYGQDVEFILQPSQHQYGQSAVKKIADHLGANSFRHQLLDPIQGDLWSGLLEEAA